MAFIAEHAVKWQLQTERWIWQEKKPEWHDCDLLVFTIFTRTSRAVCTELAAYKRSKPMMSKCDHGGTHWKASDADRFDYGNPFWNYLLFSTSSNTLASKNMSWGGMAFIAEHAVKWQLQTQWRIWQGKKPEWHDCDLAVLIMITRTSRAACTELAAYKRSKPIMSKSDHGGTHWKASDGRQVRGGLPLSGMICCFDNGTTLCNLKTWVQVAWCS